MDWTARAEAAGLNPSETAQVQTTWDRQQTERPQPANEED